MSPRRRPPRLARIYYDSPIYFVTICVRRRRSILATDAVHSALRDFAECGFEKKQIATGRYVVMPDHMHLFVSGSHEFSLKQWGRMLKLALGRAAGRHSLLDAFAKRRPTTQEGAYLQVDQTLRRFTETPLQGRAITLVVRQKVSEIWERGLFDHVIRNAESYAEKWEYVRQNPVRAGLVERAEDWPYQGEIVEIRHA